MPAEYPLFAFSGGDYGAMLIGPGRVLEYSKDKTGKRTGFVRHISGVIVRCSCVCTFTPEAEVEQRYTSQRNQGSFERASLVTNGVDLTRTKEN